MTVCVNATQLPERTLGVSQWRFLGTTGQASRLWWEWVWPCPTALFANWETHTQMSNFCKKMHDREKKIWSVPNSLVESSHRQISTPTTPDTALLILLLTSVCGCNLKQKSSVPRRCQKHNLFSSWQISEKDCLNGRDVFLWPSQHQHTSYGKKEQLFGHCGEPFSCGGHRSSCIFCLWMRDHLHVIVKRHRFRLIFLYPLLRTTVLLGRFPEQLSFKAGSPPPIQAITRAGGRTGSSSQ